MNEYNPDNWVIVKINVSGEPVFYKVLAGWSGGYLDGDSWRMNSGITKVTEHKYHYAFEGDTGSVYNCHKDQERLSMATSGTWALLQKRYPDNLEIVEVGDIVLQPN